MSSSRDLSVRGVGLSYDIRNTETPRIAPSPRLRALCKETPFQVYKEDKSSCSQLSIQVRVFRIHEMLRRYRTATTVKRSFHIDRRQRPHTFHVRRNAVSLFGKGPGLAHLKRMERGESGEVSRCSLCLCKYYREDGYDHNNLIQGRHQRCICECYCHMRAEETSIIHLAAKSGSIKVLEHLLHANSRVDILDRRGNTALHLAIMSGHTATASLLLRRGADPNKCDREGNSALHYAAQKEQLAILGELQRYGADVNSSNAQLYTPLHLAIHSKNYLTVKGLLNSRCIDVNRKDEEGNTALHMAVQFSDPRIALLLIRDQRVDVNARNIEGKTALHLATEYQRELIVKHLLDLGNLNANIVDNEGNSALHLAVRDGNLDLTKQFLTKSREEVISQALYSKPQNVDLESKNILGLTPLHMAIASDSADISECLIDSGSDILARDADGNSSLHFAVATGNLSIMKKLLSLGMDPNIVNGTGDACLHVAAHFKHLKAAEYLLTHGANVNCTNAAMSTPLHQAVDSDCEPIVDLLLNHRANINAKDVNGRTPIHLAIIKKYEMLAIELMNACSDFDLDSLDRKGDTLLHLTCKYGLYKAAKLILKLKPELLFAVNVYGNSALHYACKYRQHKLTRLLLSMAKKQKQAEKLINQTNIAGKTALHLSSKYGDVSSTTFLVDNGAHIDATDNKGQTPLHMASLSSHAESSIKISQLLVELGADINIADASGETPLHEAAKSGNSSMVSFLLANGANVDATNRSEHTPLHLAAAYGKEKSMSVLISEGADYLKTTSKGNASIHGTAASGNIQALALLVKQGVSLSTKNEAGMNMLHVAAANDQDAIIDYLVDNGMALMEKDNSGRTPLHIASSRGNVKAVEALLKYGADLNQVDNKGLSALDYAKISQKEEVVDTLLAHDGITNMPCEDESLVKMISHPADILSEDSDELLLANPLGPAAKKAQAEVFAEQAEPAEPVPDELRSDCTEDDIADQLGLLVQPLSTPGVPSHSNLQKIISSALQSKLKKDQMVVTDEEADESEKMPAKKKKERVSKLRKPRLFRAQQSSAKSSSPQSSVTSEDEEVLETLIAQLSPTPSVEKSINISTLPSLTAEEPKSSSPVEKISKPPTSSPSQSFPTIATAPPPGQVDMSRSYNVQKRKKVRSDRKGGSILSTKTPAPAITRERVAKNWLFDDDLTTDSLKEAESEPHESEVSFDIIPRSPTPTMYGQVENLKDKPEQESSADEDSPHQSESAQRRWGKAKVDGKFRDELERQRLAEERKRKAMKMKLARAQHRNAKQDRTAGADGSLPFNEDDWLAQYCIFNKGVLAMYKEVFQTLLGSSDELPNGSEKLSITETLMALNSVNKELGTEEGHNLIRVCELLGSDLTNGCDLRSFAVIAALSHKITALDNFTRRLYKQMDMKGMETNTQFCKNLWEACRDADTNFMSKEKLIIELKAGGVSLEHEEFVQQSLTKADKTLDFLDFLTYIPLFILTHKSIIQNPLDDERSK